MAMRQSPQGSSQPSTYDGFYDNDDMRRIPVKSPAGSKPMTPRETSPAPSGGGDKPADGDSPASNKPKGWGKRHTVALLGFTGFALCYMMRFNLALVIVKMVKPYKDEDADGHGKNETMYCKPPDGQNHTEESTEGEFEWSPTEIGLLLGAFFWGYVVTQIPGGMVVAKIGGKIPMGVGVFISALMSVLIPVAARTNIAMVMYCRIIQGLGQGLTYPAMQQILASWCPPDERSKLTGAVFAGIPFGAALSMIMSGYLAGSDLGWPSVFYVTSGLAFIWYFAWVYLTANSPKEQKNISEQEREYILNAIGDMGSSETLKTPWKAILTSKAVWVLAIAELCHTWGFYSLLLELPTYLKTVLLFEMESNAWISAAPELAMWAMSLLTTYVADYALNKGIAKALTIRQVSHVIAEVGAAVCLIAAAATGCDRMAVVVLLTLAVGVSGAVCASYIPNQQEIAPNHTGVVVGFVNTIGNLSGFFVPIVAAAVAKHSRNPADWEMFFYISAAFNIFSAVFYTLLTTVTEQPWNRDPDHPEDPNAPKRKPIPL